MNSSTWLQYFESNRLNRPEPEWRLPFPEDTRTATKLAHSLSHFQLGESGGGSFLLRGARSRYPDDADYAAALTLFVAEEQEHARLSAQPNANSSPRRAAKRRHSSRNSTHREHSHPLRPSRSASCRAMRALQGFKMMPDRRAPTLCRAAYRGE